MKQVWSGAAFAALCGLVATAVTLALQIALDAPLLASLAIDASSQVLGPDLFARSLEHLGANAKPLLFVGVCCGQIAAYALAWLAAGRFLPSLRIAAAALLALAALLLVSGVLVLATDASLSASELLPYIASFAAGTIVFALMLWLIDVAPQQPDPGRRRLLRGALGVSAALVAAGYLGRTAWRLAESIRPTRARGPTPEITPVEDFYIVSKNLVDPSLDAGSWRLRVGGSTARMLDLGYDDIGSFSRVEEYATMQCISNPVGGDLISTALWTGFPLAELLDRAGPLPEARYVVFRCADDYTETLPLEFARLPAVLLVYEMNNEPLTDKHGFPLRLLAPGKYGLKHPKWITEIALMDEETFGYWQKRYWTQEARMNTSSRIDVPEDGDSLADSVVRIHGIAFSGDRGIGGVEVSTDNGTSWNAATLRPALSPYTWVLWHYDWATLGRAGRADILARATDGTGEVQTAVRALPHPDGATGYPRATVEVERGL